MRKKSNVKLRKEDFLCAPVLSSVALSQGRNFRLNYSILERRTSARRRLFLLIQKTMATSFCFTASENKKEKN